MYAEDAIVDDGGQREVIEDVSAVPPNVERAVLPQAFVVKAVDLRDLPALVVPPDQGHQVRIADFVCEKKQEGLDAVEAAVHEIAEEKVADSGDVAPVFEEFEKVVELSVNVAADGYGRIDPLDVALLDQNLAGLGAQVLHLQFADDLAPA